MVCMKTNLEEQYISVNLRMMDYDMDYLLVVIITIVTFTVFMIGFRIMGNQAVGRLMVFD